MSRLDALRRSDGRITASANSASATSRISFCRMCARKICPRSSRGSKALDLATPNAGLVTDIIACPGLDYCDLANARSIPIAQRISERFADLDRQHDIGELKIKISGCINACGHHHAGHIGILGVDKKGVEYYQLQLGGSGAEDASIGDILGPAFGEHEIVDAVEARGRRLSRAAQIRRTLSRHRRRVGVEPFGAAFQGATSMPLIKDGAFADDHFVTVTDDAPMPDERRRSFRWRASTRIATRCSRATHRWA